MAGGADMAEDGGNCKRSGRISLAGRSERLGVPRLGIAGVSNFIHINVACVHEKYVRSRRKVRAYQRFPEEDDMSRNLSERERSLIQKYWAAANYLSLGQIYLYDNPLLKQKLTKEHIKPRLLGHWAPRRG
jgi:hypothetical protein